MGITIPSPAGPSEQAAVPNEAHSSGVSWAAVIAGSFITSALVLVLLALGAGLGLSSVSPWSNVGASGSAIGTAAIVWLILMETISSSMGGYLAGRLRTKWASIHTDEVYFRDTAHGFLAWAVALVITAAFLASATTAMVGAGVAGNSVMTRSDSGDVGPNQYFVDTLFRSDNLKPGANPTGSEPGEIARIFAKGLKEGGLLAADKTYLAQQVSARTGLSQADADKRVSDVFAAARQAAESTRKAIAHSLLWVFISLLIGAFAASFAATIGGRQRDHVVII